MGSVQTCSVEGCPKPAGTGKRANRERMCVMHLTRLKRHGDAQADFTRRAVLRYVENDEGCHIWSGKKDQGYGVVKVNGKRLRAHRWVYEQSVDLIPAGMTVDHVCHNAALARGDCAPGVCRHRACVNPAHLTLATIGENVRRTFTAIPWTSPGGTGPHEWEPT